MSTGYPQVQHQAIEVLSSVMEHFCEFYVEAKEHTTFVPHLKQCSRMYVTKLLFQVLECV